MANIGLLFEITASGMCNFLIIVQKYSLDVRLSPAAILQHPFWSASASAAGTFTRIIRKYSDKLDESSEGFFWEEFYHTDSEHGSDSYYWEHQEVQRKRAPVDVVPGKDWERNFQQIDNEVEPDVNADVFHLLLAHREQIITPVDSLAPKAIAM